MYDESQMNEEAVQFTKSVTTPCAVNVSAAGDTLMVALPALGHNRQHNGITRAGNSSKNERIKKQHH